MKVRGEGGKEGGALQWSRYPKWTAVSGEQEGRSNRKKLLCPDCNLSVSCPLPHYVTCADDKLGVVVFEVESSLGGEEGCVLPKCS